MFQPDKITFSYRHAAPVPPFRFGAEVPRVRVLAVDVAGHISRRCGVDAIDIFGRSNKKDIGRIKHLTVFCVHKLRPEMSYTEIGLRLGGKDHSTISHSMHMAILLRMKDRDFYELSEAVIDHFRIRT
ncbi:MAG: helix-turn-helix domain-containing protein [Parasphingorhabdus sp.]|nr:helix-turn-helix domain-containing protein [Parasphingorhabdus sp.]|tara:strand:+ start:1144 stop:1527 length:384 start_codon:yes stop_codon:yes gene_type:complete